MHVVYRCTTRGEKNTGGEYGKYVGGLLLVLAVGLFFSVQAIFHTRIGIALAMGIGRGIGMRAMRKQSRRRVSLQFTGNDTVEDVACGVGTSK